MHQIFFKWTIFTHSNFSHPRSTPSSSFLLLSPDLTIHLKSVSIILLSAQYQMVSIQIWCTQFEIVTAPHSYWNWDWDFQIVHDLMHISGFHGSIWGSFVFLTMCSSFCLCSAWNTTLKGADIGHTWVFLCSKVCCESHRVK